MQAVFTVHFWRLGVQMSSSKAPAGRATALDAELFAIRLGVAKATSFDVKHIILITDSLCYKTADELDNPWRWIILFLFLF